MPQDEHTKSDATIWLKELVNNLSSALNNLSKKQDDTNSRIQKQSDCIAAVKKQISKLELEFEKKLNSFKLDFLKEITPLKIKSKIWFQVLTAVPGLAAALWLVLKG